MQFHSKALHPITNLATAHGCTEATRNRNPSKKLFMPFVNNTSHAGTRPDRRTIVYSMQRKWLVFQNYIDTYEILLVSIRNKTNQRLTLCAFLLF